MMSLQTDTIEVTRETAAMLRAKATAHRLSLDAYLRILVKKDVGPEPAPQPRLEEFDRIWMRSLQDLRDCQCSRAISPVRISTLIMTDAVFR
jgi:hypothetical protein